MHIEFSWGDKPSGDPFAVTNFTFSLATPMDDTKLDNCTPGEINLNIRLPQKGEKANQFFEFANSQETDASSKGSGIIVLKPGTPDNPSGKESLQTITFKKGWITNLVYSGSEHDDSCELGLSVVAGEIEVGPVKLKHQARLRSVE